MIELFDEESSTIVNFSGEKRKYQILNVVSVVFWVLFGFAVIFTILFFPISDFQNGFLAGLLSLIFNLLPVVALFLTAFFTGKIRNRYYNEFDYVLVSGSLRFSKVIYNKKRKFLYKFDCSDIERMGKYNSPEFNKYFALPSIKKDILTSNLSPNEGKDFYYIVATFDGDKHLIVLESCEKFIANILKFTNVIVWEKQI